MFPIFKNSLLAFLLFLASVSYCQQFEIQNIYVDRGKVYVNFIINEKYEYERYSIQLYSSHDNYSQPLKYISGDIEGEELESTDQQLQVVWNAQKELKKFQGNVQLELRGEVTYVPLHSDVSSIKAKQKKPTTISWQGGNPGDQVRIELIKSGNIVKSLGQVSNSGRYTWNVTTDDPKGSGYSIRLVNLNNSGENFETRAFKIAGGLPLIATLGPAGAVVLGGGVYAITSGMFDGNGGNGGNEESNLPEAPVPK